MTSLLDEAPKLWRVSMKVLLINTQRPGPIEANWGDIMQITVTNRITGPEEGGILYWHGLLQVGTPWFDGASPVQQCPIAPESTFTYTFTARLYWTCWYDAHYSAHNAEGSAGSRIVYGYVNCPNSYEYLLTYSVSKKSHAFPVIEKMLFIMVRIVGVQVQWEQIKTKLDAANGRLISHN